jgi:arsenate reductase (thioredoxin)
MAEGLLAHLAGDKYESLSAGSDPAGYVHPMAIEAMREIDLDIRENVSKSINEFLPPEGTAPNIIISVCSGAEKSCPFFPGDVQRMHWPFDDPTHAVGTDEEKMAEFRRVRDEIKTRLETEFV